MLPIDEPPLDADLIRSRHAALVARLSEAAEAAGRDQGEVRIVAITKGFGIGVLLAAREAGLARFGENRVQEALPKVAAALDAEWHLVGRLQSNKARQAAHAFSAIHSVDSLDLLRRIDRISDEDSLAPRVMLQVNVTGETSKAGFELGWFEDELQKAGGLRSTVAGLAAAQVAGLMTIGPTGANSSEARGTFATLRRLRDELEQQLGRRLPELSMGMTADAEAAVAEGATLVRVGTAIFGPRPG
jgi:pyridoxal phosphate enzyme (YggS family)